MKKMKYILLMCVMMLTITACGKKEENVVKEETEVMENTEEQSKEAENTEPATIFGVFDAQTLDGESVTEEVFANADLTMVNIWGTFCGPCIAEMPDLGEISREYEEKGLQIIGIISDVYEPGDETARQIVEETKADYMHMVASEDLRYNVLQYISAVPMTIFVDKEGKMVGELQMGAKSKNQWETLIDNYLEGVK